MLEAVDSKLHMPEIAKRRAKCARGAGSDTLSAVIGGGRALREGKS